MQHPGLAEVAVHAVPGPHTEEDLKLTAVRAPSATVTEQELASWSIAQLPSSRSRATSSSVTNCRGTHWAAYSSTSFANKVSPRPRGTEKRPT
jgi:hypothetical protein